MADGGLSDRETKELERILERRHGKLKLIQDKGNDRAVIVKTTNVVAPQLRQQSGKIRLGKKEVVAVLTSGAIGKLKRRASESVSTSSGKVPDR
jgi:hypothetical protein